jgi:CheY-like chemotaxis protein
MWRATAAFSAMRASFLPLVQAATLGRREPPRLAARGARKLADGAEAPRVPLYHRPGCVAVLDDDPGFLDELTRSFPRQWRTRGFLSAEGCLNHLQQEPPLWEADFWAQQELVSLWQLGAPLIPLVLRYWATSPERHTLTSVLVVDQLMPGTDGIEMLRELVDWPGSAVLMSGDFDEYLATDAFNSGLIDQYVVKQQSSLRADLVGAVSRLLARPNPRHQQIWAGTVKPAQADLLRRPAIARDLDAYLRASFVEWIVIGEPFGVLGLDAQGSAHWLQLTTREELAAQADLSEQHGMGRVDADEVRAGRKLSNVALRSALGLDDARAIPAFQVGEQPGLLAGATRIEVKTGLQSAYRQHQWLAHVRPGNQSAV